MAPKGVGTIARCRSPTEPLVLRGPKIRSMAGRYDRRAGPICMSYRLGA